MNVRQIRVCIEEIGEVLGNFRDDVIGEFELYKTPFCEIQHRGIGINFDFREEIHRSDDEITYFLKDDKAVAYAIVRRTEFNNAEITMITTEDRFKDKN